MTGDDTGTGGCQACDLRFVTTRGRAGARPAICDSYNPNRQNRPLRESRIAGLAPARPSPVIRRRRAASGRERNNNDDTGTGGCQACDLRFVQSKPSNRPLRENRESQAWHRPAPARRSPVILRRRAASGRVSENKITKAGSLALRILERLTTQHTRFSQRTQLFPHSFAPLACRLKNRFETQDDPHRHIVHQN